MPVVRLLCIALLVSLAWGCGPRAITTPEADPALETKANGPPAAPAARSPVAPVDDECDGGDECVGEAEDEARPPVTRGLVWPADRKPRAVAIVRELESIQLGLLHMAEKADNCADLAMVIGAWVERHDDEVSDIMRLVQDAKALKLPPKEALDEVERAFTSYRMGLERWNGLRIVDRCGRDPAMATLDSAGVGRTLGSLPGDIDDLFEGAGRITAEAARATDLEEHARGLKLMRGLLEHLDAFTGRVEGAKGCDALLAVVRAWNADGRYQKLVAEARDVDFLWQDPSDVLGDMRAEAVRINARYSERFARLAERLGDQEACFETREGQAVGNAFNERMPLQDLETLD